jgi:hypothetical protein
MSNARTTLVAALLQVYNKYNTAHPSATKLRGPARAGQATTHQAHHMALHSHSICWSKEPVQATGGQHARSPSQGTGHPWLQLGSSIKA